MKKNNLPSSKTTSYYSSVIDFIKPFRQKNLFAIKNSEKKYVSITGDELINRIKKLGSLLQQNLESQQKVIILFPQGLEYIYGLMACWYANLVAIPVPLTDLTQADKLLEIINRIIVDSEVSCILTNTEITQLIKKVANLENVSVIDINQISQSNITQVGERTKKSSELAILLYSSGSNSQPKGIMITHQSLMSQANEGAKQWGMNDGSCIVSWMPQFHSFGLHFNILAPLSKGAFSVMLDPGSFLKNPNFWFDSILEHKATHTAAPNFAFDYCFDKINVTTFQSLNQFPLASIRAIICGGEPINEQSYFNFIKRFKCLGLSSKSICSHYGLSEIGSVVTSSLNREERFKSLDLENLEKNVVKSSSNAKNFKVVVSCGKINRNISVVVVEPGTLNPYSNGMIGEILINSPSVASGYINKHKESNNIFFAKLTNRKQQHYLRTGDLGFIENEHLYVVGREKDLIIINGKNHHPVDIVWSIKRTVPYLDLAVVVFSQEIANEEKVIVVQEIKSGYSQSECNTIIFDIQNAVAQNHSIKVHEIYLVSDKSIPRTGSGKIQKQACRNLHKTENLSVLHQYLANQSLVQNSIQHTIPKVNGDLVSIIEILKNKVFSTELKIPMSELESINEFSEIMLNSIQYVTISKKIEEVLELQFAPVMLFKHPSFTKLADYLFEQINSVDELASISNDSDSMKKECINTRHKKILLSSEEQHSEDNKKKVEEPSVAIIGMSCHFPGGATDTDKFWEKLVGQVNCITPIPANRKQFAQGQKNNDGTSNNAFPNWGGFLNDVDTFDAGFFGISPVEANSMDPQQRKVLEMTWSVIESGGYNPRQLLNKNVGLFIGAHNSDYLELILAQPALSEMYGAYLDSGVHMSMIANRVSRWFDFNGPSEVVNTACSSSLVAVHHAVESIVKGDCSLAVAGGINLILSPRIYKAAHSAGMLSTDGSCKSFDQKANGFVRAEGYGAVLLKSYEQAKIDNDSIYGVIKSAVINHDGKSDSLRAPNLESQTRLIKSAYKSAEVAPDSVSYIETHGTGTPLGDPIEIEALKEAFKALAEKLPHQYCGLGTVKTNIGHCESAAGIAGLIKVILSMENKILPGILHFNKLNNAISLKNSPFYVVEKNQEWKRLKGADGDYVPLRAGISSFGFGGVNAHLVLEEPPVDKTETKARNTDQKPTSNQKQLILLSAKSDKQLHIVANNLYRYLLRLESKKDQEKETNEASTLKNIAYTLQVGRHAMKERIAFVVETKLELQQMLSLVLEGKPINLNYYRGTIDKEFELVQWRSDEGLKAAVNRWLNLNEIKKLAIFWVRGLDPTWQTMYNRELPKRISLPTYPFAKNSYWLPDCTQKQCVSSNGLMKNESNSMVLKSIKKKTENIVSRKKTYDEIIDFVKTSIANNTGLSIDDIELSEELDALGIDSIVKLKLVNEIVNRYSDFSVDHSELLLLPKMIDIVNLLRELVNIELSKTSKKISKRSDDDSQDINLFVKRIIADNTGHEIREVDLSSNLSELGVDSIIRLKLVSEIVNAYPGLSLEHNELLLKQNIIEIVSFVQEQVEKSGAILTNKISSSKCVEKIKGPEVDGGAENIALNIKKIIASNTGNSINEFSLSDELSELGIDSIIKLKLTNDIVDAYPELSLAHNELLLLPKVMDIITLLESESSKVEQRNSSELSNKIDSMEATKNDEKLKYITQNIKVKPSNVMIENVGVSESANNTLQARIIISKNHSFFNDHPLDHITGVQLVESMMQLIKVSEINISDTSNYYITSMNVKFNAFCENESADVFCTEIKSEKNNKSKLFKTRVQQNKDIICKASIEIKNISSQRDTVNSNSIMSSKLRRCSRSMVNKQHKDNVFISSPCSSWDKQGCWFFPNRSSTIFSDSAEGFIDVTQLIEACRQHERSLTKRSFFHTIAEEKHTAGGVDEPQGLITAEKGIGILKSLELSLSRALLIGEEIFITNGDMNVIDVGGNRVINWQSDLLINGVVIGQYKMEALILSSDIYDSWRALESDEIES